MATVYLFKKKSIKKVFKGAKKVAKKHTKTILSELRRPKVKFYTSMHVAYMTDGAFGSDVVYVDWIDDRLVIEPVPLQSVVFDEDMNGDVDMVIRRWETKVSKAAARNKAWAKYFSENYSLEKDANKEIVVLHYVARLTPMLREKLPNKVQNFEYASVWVDKNNGEIMDVGGYDVQPYIVSRWLKAFEKTPYGRSPSMTALPDIRLVNGVSETIVRIGELQAYPPMTARRGSLLSPLRQKPGGMTFYDGEKPETLLPGGAGSPNTSDVILQRRQEAIRETFFSNLIVTPGSPVRTATEALMIADERNRALSPMVIRQTDEKLEKVMDRISHLLRKAGRTPALPGEAKGVEFDFVNDLTASQFQIEAQGTLRYAEGLLSLGGVDPKAVDAINIGKAAETIHRGSGAPASVLASETDRKKKQDDRTSQENAEQQAQLGLAGAEAGAKLISANARAEN